MYFFDIDGLIDRLASKPLTARECVSYLLGFFVYRMASEVFGTILPIVAGVPANRANPSDAPIAATMTMIVFGAIGFLILRWALLKFYDANGGEFDDQYLPNLFAVIWVVNNRLMVGYAPLIVLTYFLVSPISDLSLAIKFTVSVVALVAAFGVLFAIFSITRRSLREIRAKKVARHSENQIAT